MKKLILTFAALSLAVMSASAQKTTNNERDFQISFISPFGTNGTQSHLITNKYSINILGGYSAGNRVLELGSLYNVNAKFTSGVQAAGIVNYTGKSDEAVQFAGIANVAKSGDASFQAAGIANITHEVDGVQTAGIANVAHEVEGVQAAGIVNIADKVEGVQLGLINIAGSYDSGVPVGLINIVKEGGKQEFEVSFSEAINTTVSFKLGTEHLYTIFSVGANYINQPVNYAAGIGFGTHIDWEDGWANQIEIMGYALTEEGSFDTQLNMLTQLKFTFSKDISKRFKVFAGPVFNMTISDYFNLDTGKLGSSLAPWSLWKNDSDRTRLNAWVGFTAGIRF